MSKVKVQLAGSPPKVVVIETAATVGATIGTDLRLPNGQVATIAQLIALFGGGTTTNNSGGTDISSILTTKGDLATRDAAVQRLPIGTTGQALTVAAGMPAWGVIGIPGGGTGLSSYTTGDLIYASATNVLSKRAIGSAGQLMRVQSTLPTWVDPAALTKTDDTNVTLTLGGAPTSALVAATSLTLGWTGQLAPTRGGTGIGTYTTGDIIYASATNVLSKLAVGTNGQVLTLAGGVPTWAAGGGAGGGSMAVMSSWNFSTTTAAADPGAGNFRMNNATLASVTALYFNDTDVQLKDSSTIMAMLATGHRIYVEQDDDKTRAVIFQVSGAPTDNTGWWTVPVTVVASATLPGNTKACWANFQFVSFNANTAPETRGASFSGGLSTIVVPTNKVPISIRADCRIAGWVVLTQGGTGSCVLDILKSSYGGYPPASSLCGGNKPTLSSAVKNQDTTLTSWTTTLAAGDTLLVNLESSSTFTAISLFLVLVPISYTPPSGFTAQDARDAVGAILTDSNTIHWTYSGSTIVADVKNSSTGAVEDNQYTPTGTAVANCSAVVPSVANYLRVGSTVTVSGYVTFTCTAGGATTTQVGLSLPIASNIGATYDCAGVGASEGTVNNNNETSIRGDATNNRAELVFASSATGSVTKWYTYTYRILP